MRQSGRDWRSVALRDRPRPGLLGRAGWTARLLVLVVGLALLPPATPGGQAAPAGPQQAERCRVQAGRSLGTTFLEQGEEMDVSAWMDVDCGLLPPTALDLVLLLDVQPLAAETPDPEHADALAEALLPALDRLGWTEGSRVALIRVATAGHAIDLPLAEDRDALEEALGALDAEGLEEEGDLGPALDAAQAILAEAAEGGDPGRLPAVLLVDAGMALQTNAQGAPLNPPAAACRRVTEAGTALAVVSMQAAGRRLANVCASPGHFEPVGAPGERQLGLAVDQMLRVLAHPGSIVRVELADFLRSSFSYVEGSGVPRDPDYVVLAEHVWQLEQLEQRLQQEIDYRVRVNPGFGELRMPLSVESKLVVEHADGSVVEHALPNPTLCIHWPGREGYCIDWLREIGVRLFLPRASRP